MAIMISKKGVIITLLAVVVKSNCIKINGKEIQRSGAGFLPNLEASHFQPIYEANKSIRSHPYRGVNDHVYQLFPEPGSQR
jgi:hypothetical protein